MLVTVISEERLYGVLLPEKIRGQYRVEDPEREVTDPRRKLLSIEASQGHWEIRATRKLCLFQEDGARVSDRLVLECGKLYGAELNGTLRIYIFTEPYTQDRCAFRKYMFSVDAVVNIGKDSTNQIVIDNPYVSGIHAQLTHSGGRWMLYDCNSRNGVYVNERRIVQQRELHPGDVLYILGFKAVVGAGFIAMNNPDNTVRVQTEALVEYQTPQIMPYEAPEEREEVFYYRSPRFRREITPLELKIDGPTARENIDDTPLALSLAPSLVMGVASFSSGLFTMTNTLNNGGSILGSLPTLIMSISMLAGMIVFPFIMKARDRRRKKEGEEERRRKYLKYLENIRAEIYKASVIQQEILCENYPHIMSLVGNAAFYERSLWNRVIGQRDFLSLRLGIGNTPLRATLEFPDKRFSIDDDIMRGEVNRFSEEKKILTGVPVGFSLVEHRVSGIVGSGGAVDGILNNLILQIAALHSYDEVKIVFICEECDLEKYGYVRWLQHLWDNEFRMRFLATNLEELRELTAYFLREMAKRREDSREVPYPHYVIISTSKGLSDHCAFVAEMLADDGLQGFSYLAVYDELKNLPKECSCIVQMNDSQGAMYFRKAENGEQLAFVQDMISERDAERAVMNIAEYRLDLNNGRYALPGMLTFLEMFGVGKYEHLNIASRWKENNPVITLQVPIGVNSEGDVFYLDLHEKAHGPHGLVAGMTGSGKSEFIITYILSLAVNFSPEEVAFILIDYKGGGLTGAFDNEQYRLPHLAGTITNLDGGAITRSLLSIQSELRRRQAVFNEARRAANEGTMDIYKYQKLYRSGVVSEPMPHLFIISDEFAELKTQQPEFMVQLISTARIGRSLGVHLILATQKPNGVVNDQIWANSKFKVCLKVQDRADSMDMLKRPDAAELTETGRFYLQVGYNELFEIGQSAWCGAPYVSADEVESEIDERVQLIDRQGNVIEEAKPRRIVEKPTDNRKQIVEIAKYITQIAGEENMMAKPLWLPEIPAVIDLNEVEEKYHYSEEGFGLNPAIGEADDPFNQRQYLLTVPLTEKGNVLVYGAAGSGKELFVTAMLYSLYRHHTSGQLHAYILDFGAETLRMFERAPQTADVVIAGEDEKLTNLFRFLKREMDRRKKHFAEIGGDYVSYCRTGAVDYPNILVIINNYANFAEQYEELDDMMAPIVRDCTKYGISFVVTNTSGSGIRHKIVQAFTQTYVLQLNDKMEYVAILGNTGGVFPSSHVGRGIYKDEETYEFQIAYVTSDTKRTAEAVRKFCGDLMENSGQRKAAPIAVMPKQLNADAFAGMPVTFDSVPFALACETLEPVKMNLSRQGVVQVLAMDRHDLSPFASEMVRQLGVCADSELYVFDPGQLLTGGGDSEKRHYITDAPEETVVSLFQKTVERHNACKTAGGTLPGDMDGHPVITLIMGLGSLKEQLSEDGRDKLRLMLEKTSGKFNMAFWVLDDYAAANRYCVESWCVGNGIWIGSGIGEQIRLKIARRTASMTGQLDFGSGFIVEKGAARLIRVLVPESAETEGNDE